MEINTSNGPDLISGSVDNDQPKVEDGQTSPLKVIECTETKENDQSTNVSETAENKQENVDAVLNGRKPLIVKNTFVGGVRYFAPSEDVIPLSDDDDISPFEPNRPRFQSSRSTMKCALQDDTGERPFLIFGDIEDKISELQLHPEPGDVRAAIELKNRRERMYFKRSAQKPVESEVVFGGSIVDASSSMFTDPPRVTNDSAVGSPSSASAAVARKRPPRDIDRLTAKDALMPRGKQASAATLKGRKPAATAVLVEPLSIMRPEPNEDLGSVAHKPLTPDEQLKADANSLIASVLAKGTRVLAKWLDKILYSGIIVRNDILGGYKVRFTDGESREMPSSDVVPLFRLKEGDELMLSVTSRRGQYEFQPSVITKCPDKKNAEVWNAGMFEVENKTKLITETVSWEQLAIESRQIKNYITQKRTVTSLSQIVPNDTSSGSRRSLRPKRPKLISEDYDTSPRNLDVYDFEDDYAMNSYDDDDADDGAAFSTSSSRKARSSTGAAKRGRWVQVASVALNDDSAELASQRRKGTPRTRPYSKHPEISPYQAARPKPPPLAPEGAPTLTKDQKPSAGAVITKSYQQIDRTLFSEMKFLLTSATRVKDPSATNEDADQAPPMMPFVKRQVRQMIEERGGIVVEDFSLLGSMSDTYLVADQFYRTHKYISALVRAVPCVSHMWIYECCKESRLLHPTIFMLPAGRTLENNEIVKWHDKCPTLLAGLHVYMHTENKPVNPNTLNFVQIWTPIAKLMGANIVEKLPETGQDPISTKIDILLTDSSCPTWVVDCCASYGAHAVSSEWLIQGIIAGRLLQIDAHPKYKHDYTDQPAPAPRPKDAVVQASTVTTIAAPGTCVNQVVSTAPSAVDNGYTTVQIQPQHAGMEATSYLNSASLDPASLSEGIDISNMTAEQLQALGIQFVEATDLSAVSSGGQERMQQQETVQQAAGLHQQDAIQMHLQQQREQLQQQEQQQNGTGANQNAEGDVIMISPEDLQLLSQEGVQIITQNGVIIIQQADGTQTVVAQAGIGDTQIQFIESTEDGATSI